MTVSTVTRDSSMFRGIFTEVAHPIMLAVVVGGFLAGIFLIFLVSDWIDRVPKVRKVNQLNDEIAAMQEADARRN